MIEEYFQNHQDFYVNEQPDKKIVIDIFMMRCINISIQSIVTKNVINYHDSEGTR